MSRHPGCPDMTNPRPYTTTLAGRIARWIFVGGLIAGVVVSIGARLAHAEMLVQMPPARWHGCKPNGSVTIVRHFGTVDCGGIEAPSCTRRRGKNYVIDLQTGESCVTGKMLIHEWAHTCGWNHQGMRWERCP
jgi:hypothetical protein